MGSFSQITFADYPVFLYWNIGEYINKKIAQSEWGDSVVTELAKFIQAHEPEIKGFSDKNIWRMKQFYETYKSLPKLSPAVRESNNDLSNTFKDSYVFEFLNLQDPYSESDLQRGLQCLIAFELKADKFSPDHLGQLNFYLEALDRDVKKPNENPKIGVLLCKDKDSEVVEYA